jgi:hypothetical protein
MDDHYVFGGVAHPPRIGAQCIAVPDRHTGCVAWLVRSAPTQHCCAGIRWVGDPDSATVMADVDYGIC